MRTVLAAITTLALAPLAPAQDSAPVRSISVTGTKLTKTPPDQIVWSVQLTDRDPDLQKVKTANDQRVEAVIALARKLGVAPGDLETGTVNIRREYHEDDRGRRLEFRNFVIYRTVTIRQRNLQRFDEFMDGLVASTEMEVGFSYDSSKIHEVRAQTRLEALKIAQEKAAAMASTVGAKLGEVLTIQEHPADGSGGRSMIAQNAITFTATPGIDAASERFVPGALDVQVTVYATFALQ